MEVTANMPSVPVVVSTLALLLVALPEQADAAPLAAPSPAPAPRPLGRVRLDLGLGLEPFALVGAAIIGRGLGGLGPVGGLVPSVSAAVEVRLAGPVWLLVRGTGAYQSQTGEGAPGFGAQTAENWSARLATGVRVEPQVLGWLDVGGHVLVEGRLGGMLHDRVSQGSDASLGATAGASLHFRPSAVFGTRLSLDVLRGAYQVIDTPWGTAESASVELTAAPRVELTFGF